MNPFIIITTLSYIGASIWYALNGQYLLAGTFVGYTIANVFILFIK